MVAQLCLFAITISVPFLSSKSDLDLCDPILCCQQWPYGCMYQCLLLIHVAFRQELQSHYTKYVQAISHNSMSNWYVSMFQWWSKKLP
jgi:hypothetical protein